MTSQRDIPALKQRVQAEVDRLAPDLLAASRFLHTNPELAYEEYKAAEHLTTIVAQHGFAVTRGVAGLPTAFIARTGGGSPRIAFLAEYDALPGLGHACGHNLIGTASLGAALAVKAVLGELSSVLCTAQLATGSSWWRCPRIQNLHCSCEITSVWRPWRSGGFSRLTRINPSSSRSRATPSAAWASIRPRGLSLGVTGSSG